MKERKRIQVDKTLVIEIENVAGAYGISNIQASKLIAKKLKNKKETDFYHF